MKRKTDPAKELINVDESVREIASLAELYDELFASAPKSRKDLDTRRDEARFARDRILRLSLHVKNEVDRLESSFR